LGCGLMVEKSNRFNIDSGSYPGKLPHSPTLKWILMPKCRAELEYCIQATGYVYRPYKVHKWYTTLYTEFIDLDSEKQ